MVKITVKPTNIAGVSQFEFEADAAVTVGDLKQLLSPQLGGLAPQSIRLVCAGRVWQDEATLESYGVKEGSIVHCLNNPQSQATAGIASTQELQPANPMMNMMGMPPLGNAQGGGDSFQSMMAQSQQMMAQNPELMQQMMQSPMVQSMLENPDTMRMMMQMNPQTRQLMEEHPEIARMLDDPEMLRQSARMMANPSLMREMQRNQDTAMGRLDAMPGGHAALARMHRDVVDPLQNAMTAGGDSNANINQYSEDAQGHRNTAPLANPWGPPQPAAQPPPSATGGYSQPAQLAVQPAAPAPGNPAAGTPADPMQQLMQMQMGGGMQQPGGANPMMGMMQSPMFQQMQQRMMQDPQMMQQMMQMSQNMFSQQGGAGGGQTNPMANMMQQMQQNPQMMQQIMQMSQNMFGQQGGAGMPSPPVPAPGAVPPVDAPSTTTPPSPGTDGAQAGTQPNAASQTAVQPVSPAMNQPVNPFGNMMQMMQQNPQLMQNAMQMMQQNPQMMQSPMFNQGMYGQNPMFQPNPMFGAPPAQTGAQTGAMDEAALAAAASNPMVRARFAQQLESMIAMGFSDEQKCLRALVQCDGNVDRALDKLFAEN